MKYSHALAILLLLMVSGLVYAHEEGTPDQPFPPDIQLAMDLRDNSYNVVGLAAVALIILVVYSIKKKPRKDSVKKTLFILIAIFAIGSNFYLAGTTLYINSVSPTGGPVHWHTDYEIYNCGTKLDLVDPTGWENRVGTWEVHEHNDDRMHIEGTILDHEQDTYHHFFETVGGQIDPVAFVYPTNQGLVTIPASGKCNGQPAELQVYRLYVTNPDAAKHWEYTQEKLTYPEGLEKEMAGYSNVPPGDCLIMEYGPIKDKTEHSCASYRAAMNRGELHGR